MRLEIQDWVRAVARRRRFVIVVPLLAAILAVVPLALEGPRYRATATVVVPMPESASPPTANQLVENFVGAISSEAVAEGTEIETGVPAARIQSGMSAEQNGTSNVVEVSYSGSDPSVVSDVVVKGSENGLALLAEAVRAPAQAELELAREAFDAVYAGIEEFLTQEGLVVPELVFADAQRRLIRLRDDQQAAAAAGQGRLAQELEGRIDRKTEDLSRQTREWQVLQSASSRATNALAQAEDRFNVAESQLAAFEGTGVIRGSRAREIRRLPLIVRRVVAAAGFGVVLAVGIVILLEAIAPGFRRPSPRPRAVVPAGDR